MQIEFPAQNQPKEFQLKVWLVKNKATIGFAILAVLAALTFFLRLSLRETSDVEDFFQSNQQIKHLALEQEPNEALIANLQKKHPELAPAFSHHLLKFYKESGYVKAAKETAEDSLRRLSYMDENYLSYSHVSQMIEEKKYEEALGQSSGLEKRLNKEAYPKLYLFNLLRIGFLHFALGQDAEGVASLRAVREILYDENNTLLDKQGRAEMISHLSAEQVNLFDLMFIE